jgi:hypothetical protein
MNTHVPVSLLHLLLLLLLLLLLFLFLLISFFSPVAFFSVSLHVLG